MPGLGAQSCRIIIGAVHSLSTLVVQTKDGRVIVPCFQGGGHLLLIAETSCAGTCSGGEPGGVDQTAGISPAAAIRIEPVRQLPHRIPLMGTKNCQQMSRIRFIHRHPHQVGHRYPRGRADDPRLELQGQLQLGRQGLAPFLRSLQDTPAGSPAQIVFGWECTLQNL